ncbi:MAG: DUF1449 family protein [Deltaproteobacteria bacterium]|nr:DUF1449 family protein [Deltaproteobacteria bacterium]MCW5807390.1 DUF1449 family protein [Deltaproteobacteria bacterium]
MLLDAALAFPTVVFTIALGICLVYWLFVLLGALDIDLFGHDADISGAAKGIGGGGHDAGGGGHDHHIDAHGGLWTVLGLGTVPLTISISFIVLACWCISLLTMHYAGDHAWLRAAMVPGALIVALPVAGLLARPLAPVFRLREGKSNSDYVGHVCTITTGHVDDGFGQANVEDGATVLVIPVRCDKPGALARGSKALIIDFDPARQAYVVEPSADMLPDSTSSAKG